MIKSKLISLIRGKILNERPNADRLYLADERRVELDIAAAFNTVYYQIFKKEPSNLDRYVKTYTNGGAGIPILYDTPTDTYYSILPAKVIQYPVTGDGVWSINQMQGKGTKFVPMQRNDIELMDDSDVALISTVIGFIVSGSRIEYFNMDTSITSVKMDLVVDFTEWGMDEDIPIPAGQDQNIINMVVSQFKLTPTDRLNNQNEVA